MKSNTKAQTSKQRFAAALAANRNDAKTEQYWPEAVASLGTRLLDTLPASATDAEILATLTPTIARRHSPEFSVLPEKTAESVLGQLRELHTITFKAA